MSEWISVKDSLPVEGSVVAILVASWGPIPYTGYINEDGKWCDADGQETGEGFNSVTHWMPLPEAPKD